MISGYKMPLIPGIAWSSLSVGQTQAVGCAWSALEDEGGRVVQGMNLFPFFFLTDPGSFISSQVSRPGLCTLKSTSSPPSHIKALLSPAYLSHWSSRQASRRAVLAVAAPATGTFEKGCYVSGGEMQKRR